MKKIKDEKPINNEDDLNKMKNNKKLAHDLLKELKIKKYSKNIIKSFPKCIIFKKNFIINLSKVISIQCGIVIVFINLVLKIIFMPNFLSKMSNMFYSSFRI